MEHYRERLCSDTGVHCCIYWCTLAGDYDNGDPLVDKLLGE